MRRYRLWNRVLSLVVCIPMLTAMVPVSAADSGTPSEPELSITQIPWQKAGENGKTEEVMVSQYRFTF